MGKTMKKKKKKAAMIAAETMAGIAGVSAATVGVVALEVSVSGRTRYYNAECNHYRRVLAAEVKENRHVLNEKLKTDPNYVGDRTKAVATAYKYEAADVKMGGKGSANWNASERKELLETGKVRGSEGHHINSVAENPSQQTDPNNIRFYRSKKEHLEEGHNGNYRNPSSGQLVDRDIMLKNTNRKRVIANEALGVLVVGAVGACTGLGYSIYNTCKREGVTFRSLKKGFRTSGNNVMYSTLSFLACYGAFRGVDLINK